MKSLDPAAPQSRAETSPRTLVDPVCGSEPSLPFDVEPKSEQSGGAGGADSPAWQLLRLSAALADVTSVHGAAEVALSAGLEMLDADTGGIYLVDETTGAHVLAAARGFPEEVVAAFRAVPADARVPSTDVIRTGDAVILRSPDEMAERYPHLADLWEGMASRALVVLPLAAHGRVIGTLGYSFSGARELPVEELAFATAVAQQSAQAIERARLFDAERRARLDAESANAVKMQFLATMSHELRTPLNAIGGYAQLLELGVRGPVTPAQQQDLQRIQQSQAHLLSLLDTVLDFARIEAGRTRYDIATVPVSETVCVVEALIAPQLQAKGLVYVCEPCPRALAVRADAAKLRQVVLNLLTNAVKFTPEGGRITVSVEVVASSAGNHVAVRVADNGIGIDSPHLARVFEPFVQLGEIGAGREGVGLGLAISRDLVRAMGGDLTVESELGVGSTFTIMLPAA